MVEQVAQPGLNEAGAFFRALFTPYDEGHVELRALRSGAVERAWFPVSDVRGDMSDVLTWVEGHDEDGWDVYTGVLPRRAAVQQSTKEQVSAAAWLWADLDFKDVPAATAWGRVESYDPAIVVETGGGIHIYNPTSRVLPITGTTRGSFEKLLKRFQSGIGADKTNDVTRILRVPGTVNHKPERNGARVCLRRCEGWEAPPTKEEAIAEEPLLALPDALDCTGWQRVLFCTPIGSREEEYARACAWRAAAKQLGNTLAVQKYDRQISRLRQVA